MYKGFDLKIENRNLIFSGTYGEECYQEGLNIHNRVKNEVKRYIDKKVFEEEVINGTELQNNWFPEVNADMFLSHSHKDEKLAITFSGWLKKEFGLTTFIDSCCWGYSNELALKLNNEYNYNSFNSDTYNFDKAMNIAGHIHMMLSTALANMIDKTECIMFLNTPNSISSSDTILKTYSPWIYNEIEITRIIEKKQKSKMLMENKHFKMVNIEYELNTEHLCNINEQDLIDWKYNYDGRWSKLSSTQEDKLNYLYKLHKAKGDK